MSEIVFEHVLTFNFRRQVLTMIQAPLGSKFEDVMRFALGEQRRLFDRDCSRVRLAEAEDQPVFWNSNPAVHKDREMWLLVCVWIYWDGFRAYDRLEKETL